MPHLFWFEPLPGRASSPIPCAKGGLPASLRCMPVLKFTIMMGPLMQLGVPSKHPHLPELSVTVLSCLQVLLLLDIDFMVSNNLNSPDLQDQMYQAVQAEQLLVLPAFEASLENEAGQQLVDAACAGRACTAHTAM